MPIQSTMFSLPRGGEAFLTPTSGFAPNGLPYLDWFQAALQIDRAGASWSATLATPITITYAFRASGQPPAGNGVSVFAQFNAAQIVAAEEALRLWAEVANITFVRVGSGTTGPGAYSNNAAILFANFVNGPPQFSAFAYLPAPGATAPSLVEGDIWVNVSRDYDADPLSFPLGWHILAHEIGHTLGLLHPGVYDGGAAGGATYANDADHWQDTLQFTNMSYFSETNTGAYFGGSYSITPMLHDIAAAQRLYGANMTTRTGATTYGFNSNAGHAAFTITSPNQIAIFCIWDAGGDDTLDLSGFTTGSHLDLREELFSSAGADPGGTPLVGNISIARGAVIENAIGGGGGDVMIGNGVANRLTGNGSADSIDGGGGVDTAVYALASTAASWTRNPDGTWTVSGGANGTDTLTSMEFLDFSDRDVFLDRAARTFSGDGTSDILLRRDDGVTAIWTVNGTMVTSSAPTQWQAGAEWSLQGFGDFNGDGRDDFLLRRTDGVTAVWSMNGTSVIASNVTTWQAGTEWQIQRVGDFDGDGRDDFLWRRASDGVTAIWNMNAGAVVSADVTQWQAGNEWQIQGVGDFNGDGRDDFLWRRVSDGVTSIWSMNGAAVASADVTSQQAGADWSFAGVGDFDGDGRDDLLLRRDDGVLSVWKMNGVSVISAEVTSQQAGGEWGVAGVGDYNGDGRDDILLRHDNGLIAIWTMNGASVVGADLTTQQTSPDWSII